MLGALGWRLRRNYLWIYLAVLVVWVAKLRITGDPNGSLISDATVGSEGAAMRRW